MVTPSCAVRQDAHGLPYRLLLPLRLLVQVEECIAARAAARAAKDFAAADAVRVELAGKGIMLMDTPQGTTWRPGLPDTA